VQKSIAMRATSASIGVFSEALCRGAEALFEAGVVSTAPSGLGASHINKAGLAEVTGSEVVEAVDAEFAEMG
jgi:hypothetical protein